MLSCQNQNVSFLKMQLLMFYYCKVNEKLLENILFRKMKGNL